MKGLYRDIIEYATVILIGAAAFIGGNFETREAKKYTAGIMPTDIIEKLTETRKQLEGLSDFKKEMRDLRETREKTRALDWEVVEENMAETRKQIEGMEMDVTRETGDIRDMIGGIRGDCREAIGYLRGRREYQNE